MAVKTRFKSRKFVALLVGTAMTVVLIIALWKEPAHLVVIGSTYLTVCVAGYMGANAFQRTRPVEAEKDVNGNSDSEVSEEKMQSTGISLED